MDKWFKSQRAHEEIARLNVEIRRFLTYICDEESELRQKEEELASSSPTLSFQIGRYRQDRQRFNKQHIRRLVKLAQSPGFSGELSTGVPVNGWGVRGEGSVVKLDMAEEKETDEDGMEVDQDDGADESNEEDASDIEASDAALVILEVSQREH
jgi:hypothetical protein